MRNSTKLAVVAVTLLALSIMTSGCAQPKPRRYGSVIGIKQESIEEYKRLHADVWPAFLQKQPNRKYKVILPPKSDNEKLKVQVRI